MDGSTSLVGHTIAGKFVILSFLGGGAMGAVYKARQFSLDKIVAIKVMHPDRAGNALHAALFQREAQAASRLDHPNSVRVLDFGQEPDGLLYIAMEYFPGRDLHRLLTDDWPLPSARIADILSQALAAIAVAHDMGIVHRDLKPENILVQEGLDDEGRPHDVVKVCDFGIAKIVDSGSIPPPLTEPRQTQGVVIGTPHYMSPEQGRGETLDSRTDIYSMGIILYQLLTSRLPFDGETLVDVVVKHVRDQPVPPTQLSSDVDPRLEAVCLRALMKSRDDRFQSAREMRAAVRAILALPGTETPAPLPVVDKEAPTWPPEGPERSASNATPRPTVMAPRRVRGRAVVVFFTAILGITSGAAFAVARRLSVQRAQMAPPHPALAAANLTEPPGVTTRIDNTAAPLVGDAAAVASAETAAEAAPSEAPKAWLAKTEPRPVSNDATDSASTAAGADPTRPSRVATAVIAPTGSLPALAVAPPTPTSSAVWTAPPAATAPPSAAPAPAGVDVTRARVDWSVVGTGGGATAAEVRRALAHASPVWTACYQAALRAGGERVVGTANLHIATDEEGNVVQSSLAGFPLSGVDACVSAAARVRVAGVDTGAAWADVRLMFRLEGE